MILLEDIPEPIEERYQDYQPKQQNFLKNTDIDEDYYYQDVDKTRTNYTAAQLQKIKDHTDIKSTVNWLYSRLKQKTAILSHIEPSHKIVPIDSEDKEAEQLALELDRLKHKLLRESDAILETEQYIVSILTRGLGIVGIRPNRFYMYGELPIEYAYYHPSEVIFDPNSKKQDLNYSEGYFTEKEITLPLAQREFGPLIEAINQKYGRNLTIEYFSKQHTSVSDERNQVFWRYGVVHMREWVDKIYTTCYYVPDEFGVIQHVFAENLEPQQVGIIEQAIETESNVWVRKNLMLGDYLVQSYVEPVRYFPLDRGYYEWKNKTYMAYGLSHYAKGIQDGIDKLFAQMILNATLINNAGYKAPYGGIPDDQLDSWKNWADPTVIKFYNVITKGTQTFVPEREQVEQLSNAYPVLLQMLSQGLDTVTNIGPAITGEIERAGTDVFSTLSQMQNSQLERIQMTQRHINISQMRVGRIVADYLAAFLIPGQEYATANTRMRFSKEQINKIRMARTKLIALPADAVPTQKMAIARELMKIAQTTPDPIKKDFFIIKALQLSGVRGIQDIIEDLNINQQLQKQIAEIQGTLEREQEKSKQFENRAERSETSLKVERKYAQLAEGIIRAAAEAKADIEIDKLNEQLKDARKKAETDTA